jgi:hypothetical protein
MNAQERFDYLNETVQVRNQTGWTVKKILKQSNLPAEVAVMVAGKLESSLAAMASGFVPFTQTTLNALSQESGLAIDDDVSQSLIDQLAIYSQSLPEPLRWDAEFVAIVKSLGVENKPRWQVDGYESQPTMAEVQIEIDEQRLINAKALFSERMTVGGNAQSVWAQAWEDAGE